ncbi:hypothetical protein GCM10027596_19370 [Nocardioides korecus]
MSARPVRRRSTRALIGLVGLLVSVLTLSGCSIYDVPLPGGPKVGSNPITVKVMFRDVLDLVPQSTVKVNDVSVGKVTKVDLKGYVAVVTLALPHGIDLPDNARAQIRQTSLLGEKFVSLEKPSDPSSTKLGNGDTIGLENSGRNPEVEEVLGALSLLLNGGGVGQLKTIVSELNNAFSGNETQARSLITQLSSFIGQLDKNKASIVLALDNTNRLAANLRKQDTTIKNTLDDVPAALASVNRQRADLVKLLKSLTRLSGVGVRVIKASKQSTINTLRDLDPVLQSFSRAGDNLAKSFQVFLTYPFVDEAVGRSPRVARNLHMGDYTNLSVNLNLDLLNLPTLPTGPVCDTLDTIRQTTKDNLTKAAQNAADALPNNPLITGPELTKLKKAIYDDLVDQLLKAAVQNCRAPSVQDIAGLITKDYVTKLLDTLNILSAKQIQQLLNGTLGKVGGALTGGSGSGSSGSGGLAGTGVTLPRTAPGGTLKAEPIDPFGLSKYGLDPGIGTMLLQGVATVR